MSAKGLYLFRYRNLLTPDTSANTVGSSRNTGTAGGAGGSDLQRTHRTRSGGGSRHGRSLAKPLRSACSTRSQAERGLCTSPK